MQVRVDGKHRIEALGEELADHPLADHLAGMEGDVLAHVGQVRRHQQQAAGAETARLAGHQQQLDQLLVGAVEAAVQHQGVGQHLALSQRQAQAQLVVGKAVAFDARGRQAGRRGQTFGGITFVGEIQQQCAHR
ncbi:hypothetical protein D9M71_507610 [compost metagenome]